MPSRWERLIRSVGLKAKTKKAPPATVMMMDLTRAPAEPSA